MKMSKSAIAHKPILIALLALAVCALSATLVACHGSKANIAFDEACYEITLSLDGDKLTASQELLYTAPKGMCEERLVMHLYANAFAPSHDAINILSAQIDRLNVGFTIYGDDKTLLSIPYRIEGGNTYTVALQYEVTLQHGNYRLGVTDNGAYNLTCFYPVAAKYENGWREDVYYNLGDPFFSDISSFYVTAEVDDDLNVAASGKVETLSKENGKQQVYVEAEHIRDFAMAVGNFERLDAEVSLEQPVSVNYFYTDDASPSATLKRATDALTEFSKAFGDYPYSTLSVVQSKLDGAGGMEYGALALVCDDGDKQTYLDVVTHEIAHQWWYGAVGNDQLNSGWLDEGLAEFCTHYFSYLTGDRQSFRSQMSAIQRSYSSFEQLKHTVGFDGTMDRHLSTYISDGEYVAVTYLKGALLFDNLHTLVGDEKFKAALSAYYCGNKFKTATKRSLAAAFQTQGFDISPILDSWLFDAIS